MTVQELIDKLNLIELKSVEIFMDSDYPDINTIQVSSHSVMLTSIVAEDEKKFPGYKFIH